MDGAIPTLRSTVLDSPAPRALGRFYGALLEWIVEEADDTWVRVHPDVGPGIAIQLEPLYAAPTWPAEAGQQLMMAHLDLLVRDMAAAADRAESLGARRATWQPQPDVVVMLDPHGHPFCLFEQ